MRSGGPSARRKRARPTARARPGLSASRHGPRRARHPHTHPDMPPLCAIRTGWGAARSPNADVRAAGVSIRSRSRPICRPVASPGLSRRPLPARAAPSGGSRGLVPGPIRGRIAPERRIRRPDAPGTAPNRAPSRPRESRQLAPGALSHVLPAVERGPPWGALPPEGCSARAGEHSDPIPFGPDRVHRDAGRGVCRPVGPPKSRRGSQGVLDAGGRATRRMPARGSGGRGRRPPICAGKRAKARPQVSAFLSAPPAPSISPSSQGRSGEIRAARARIMRGTVPG